jgi:hypothetical protein
MRTTMKKLLLFTLLIPTILFATTPTTTRIDTTVATTYFVKILTPSIDTVDVTFSSPQRFNAYTIVATSTATDTLKVYIQSKDGSVLSQQGVINLAADSAYSLIPAGTASKEFLILDPQPPKIRVVSTSMDASTTTIILAGKNGYKLH